MIEKVLAGYQLNSPTNCPPQLYDMMKACWAMNLKQRPNFDELYVQLNQLWWQEKAKQSEGVVMTQQKIKIYQ